MGSGELIFLCLQVRGYLPSSFLGQGMLLSWLGLLKGRRKGLLTCLWAVPHRPCASIGEAADPPALHMGNPQGHQPGPPDSLVSAGMRDALWERVNSQEVSTAVTPKAPRFHNAKMLPCAYPAPPALLPHSPALLPCWRPHTHRSLHRSCVYVTSSASLHGSAE